MLELSHEDFKVVVIKQCFDNQLKLSWNKREKNRISEQRKGSYKKETNENYGAEKHNN